MESNNTMPMLIPIEQHEFWSQIRQIIKEEINQSTRKKVNDSSMETSGLTQKPLYKISDLCSIFYISRTTIYDWVKHGELKRVKIKIKGGFFGC